MKRAPNQPFGDVHIYGGVFVKEHRVPDAGTLLPQHAHSYDHMSYLAAGSVQVWRGEENLGVFHAPAAIGIPARAKHRFLTLADDTLILCVHAVAYGEAADIHEEHDLALED